MGTHDLLIGADATKEKEDQTGIDTNVTVEYPPTYIWCGDADGTVPPENTYRMKTALEKEGISFQCDVFPGVDHGVGLGLATGTSAEGWIFKAIDFWMKQ